MGHYICRHGGFVNAAGLFEMLLLCLGQQFRIFKKLNRRDREDGNRLASLFQDGFYNSLIFLILISINQLSD